MGKKILIYCEGGFKLGLGNIYRSLSLAGKMISHKDTSVSFVTSSDDYIREIIWQKGFGSVYCNNQSEVFDRIVREKPDVLVIDFLGIPYSLVKKVKDAGVKVVIIGNDSDANREADLVVNAIIGTNFENSVRVDKYGTKYLEGPKYLVLRDEFTSRRNQYSYKGELNTITLLFGGTDQANLSCRILRTLVSSGKTYLVTLILGAGYKYMDDLECILSENKNLKVRILNNISNVAETLLDSDFMLTSAGTALFEAFCLGIPSIAFFQNESQQNVFGNFFMTRRYLDSLDIIGLMNEVYGNIDFYREKLADLEVGTGEYEIIDNILNL